jgi:hypothetical protein
MWASRSVQAGARRVGEAIGKYRWQCPEKERVSDIRAIDETVLKQLL